MNSNTQLFSKQQQQLLHTTTNIACPFSPSMNQNFRIEIWAKFVQILSKKNCKKLFLHQISAHLSIKGVETDSTLENRDQLTPRANGTAGSVPGRVTLPGFQALLGFLLPLAEVTESIPRQQGHSRTQVAGSASPRFQ